MAFFSRFQTIDHKLPTSHAAKWPAMCVECGAGDSDSEYKCIGVWFLGALPLRWNVVKMPACRVCARRLRHQRWFGRIEFLIIALLACGTAGLLGWALGLELSRWTYKLLVALVAIVVVCFLPHRPARVDIAVSARSTTYQFRDPEFASKFMELNFPVTTEKPTGSP